MEDEELLLTLAESKATSAEITQKVREAEKNERNIYNTTLIHINHSLTILRYRRHTPIVRSSGSSWVDFVLLYYRSRTNRSYVHIFVILVHQFVHSNYSELRTEQ